MRFTSSWTRTTTLAVALLSLISPAVAQPPDAPPVPTNRTVVIDCDTGDSLADALATRADHLTVRFRGNCEGGVTIDRGNVTLEGRDASATIGGGGVIGLTITGGPNQLGDFFVTGFSTAGILVARNGEATIETVESSGNGVGLGVDEGGSVRLVDVTVNGNSTFGVSVFGNSAAEIAGPIVAKDNGFVGVIASTGSALQGVGPTAALLAENNGIAGLWLQLGAHAQGPNLTASDNLNGDLVLFGHSMYVGDVDLRSFIGVFTSENDTLLASGSISSAVGLVVGEETIVDFGNTQTPSTIGGAIFAAGSILQFSNVQIGSANLRFASRLTVDSNTTIGVLQCDGTVLTRGISCPAALTTSELRSSAPGLPSQPFANPVD